MAARKMNVLVYSGTGSTVESVKHSLYSLRQLLSPHYAVIPVTESVLLKEPWAPSCALLVFPGGADMGYCRVLNGPGNRRIGDFVRQGGAYLGFCAGGYYGSGRCEFEVGNPALEVVGRRELAFFPGPCRGAVFQGFDYSGEGGARAVRLVASPDSVPPGGPAASSDIFLYCNGGGVFVGAGNKADQGVEVLARYADDLDVDGEGQAAVVCCKVGSGTALLTGPHPEWVFRPGPL
jgi:biotin---protein ligase